MLATTLESNGGGDGVVSRVRARSRLVFGMLLILFLIGGMPHHTVQHSLLSFQVEAAEKELGAKYVKNLKLMVCWMPMIQTMTLTAWLVFE